MSISRWKVYLFSALVIASACAFGYRRVSAQTSAPAGGKTYGIASLNPQEAIANTIEGKKAVAALNQRFGPKDAAFKQQRQEIETLEKQLQAPASLTAVERNRRAAQLETKQRTLQRSMEAAQAEFQKAQEQTMGPISAKMLRVLENYAQANGYVLVVDSTAPGAMLWTSPAADITKELTKAYDAALPNP